MSEIRLAHFYDWGSYTSEFIRYPLEEFADNGAKYLVFTIGQCQKILNDASYAARFFGAASDYQLEILDVHGLCFGHQDLNTDNVEHREISIREHKRVIEELAGLGAKTYTVHIGAALYVREPFLDIPRLRENAMRSLDELVPFAEKTGMILALENSFEPTNTPDEILYFINHYKSDNVLCCYDSGHANYMKKEGKEMALFSDYHVNTAWRGNLQLEEDALGKLAPYVVTAHLHDNSGYNDCHKMPGEGIDNWEKTISELKKCSLLQSFQNESSAKKYDYTIKKKCEVFQEIVASS